MRGSPRVSVPAVALSIVVLVLLSAYALSFRPGQSKASLLLAGTVLVLRPDLPLLNVSFWVDMKGTSLVGGWASDGPLLPVVVPFGVRPLFFLPHGLLDQCGGFMNVALEPGHYTLTALVANGNVTRLTVIRTFELAPTQQVAGEPSTAVPCAGAAA